MSKDLLLFEKTVYEIQIAVAYMKNSYKLRFIETQSNERKKTPDIFINYDDGIEIECKKKTVKSKRDMKILGHWKEIMMESSKLMENIGKNYSIFIKMLNDPKKEDIDFILLKLYELMNKKTEGLFTYTEKGIFIELIFLSEKDKIIEATGVKVTKEEPFDFVVPTFEIKIDENKKVFIKNPRIFGFKNEKKPDRLKSIIYSIEHGKKQLSGKLPGIIYVNLNTLNSQMAEQDFKNLEHSIKKILNDNTTITAVVITAEFPIKTEDFFYYAHRTKLFLNEKPKNSLSPQFKIVGI